MAMTATVEMIEAQALQLPREERARLLERLVASLDTDDELEAAWDAVAEGREAEVRQGSVQAAPLDEAVARLEARFGG
jgi:hypothetical protein